MVALYTIHAILHLPFSGQSWGFRQLHAGASGLGVEAKALVLWDAMIDPMLRIQL